MFPPKAASFSSMSQSFDESQWVINIRQTLDADLEDDIQVPVCIFSVPKTLMCSNPDLYTPQQVAIGPYHRLRPELYEMERYKLAAARRMQCQYQTFKFHQFVEKLGEMELRIRACYHKYVEFNSETFSWMMAMDASFLLEFLQIYNVKKCKTLTRISSRMSHLVDHAGRKSGHNEILRDIMMLENQIPVFVLRKLLEFQFVSNKAADDVLFSMLMGLFKELSPFKRMADLPETQVQEYAHILDFLYQMTMPKTEKGFEIADEEHEEEANEFVEEETSANSRIRNFWQEIKHFLRRAFTSRPAGFILRLPWTILSNLPGFTVLKVSSGYLFPSQENEARPRATGSESPANIEKSPLVEEITIPSVSELHKSGLRFKPTSGSISTVQFDSSSGILYLPLVDLDVNTEVILRNLVAYEASNASGPLVFTRYTELMNGIIDSENDVRLLREQGIIVSHLKNDEEAARLWNGMSKSVRLTKVPFLDKAIEEVNAYYRGQWRVKIRKFMELYVYGSLQFIVCIAAIFLLLLVSSQVLSLVYSSLRLLRLSTTLK